MTEKSWNIGGPGGPAGPFYSVVKPDGQIVAMQILTQEMAELIASIPQLQAEVERLRGEPERVLAYVYESLTKEPWDASRGPLTANCLWIEIGKWIDQARAEERERCAALCDAEAAIWDGMSGVGEQRAVRIGRTVAAQGLARAIRALD